MSRRLGRAGLFTAALIVPMFALVTPARAQDPDPWFGRDKALHFSASAVIAAGGYGAGALLGDDDTRLSLAVGGGLGLTAGVAKELWDLSGHGDASWRDLTWDGVGVATGLIVAAAVDWTLSRLCSRRASSAR